jgi:dihydroxyacetone kinase-like predicted kinase
LAFDPIQDIKANYKIMNHVIDRTKVGKVSRASKVVKYSHIEINKNDFIGIEDKKVIAANTNLLEITKQLVDKLAEHIKKPEIAYIVNGKDVTIRDTKDIRKYIEETKSIKVIEIDGQQATYNYYIAIQ